MSAKIGVSLFMPNSGHRSEAGEPIDGVNAARREGYLLARTRQLTSQAHRERHVGSGYDGPTPPRKTDHGGQRLVTEFEIRRELAAIDTSRFVGLGKARRLIRIARKVRSGAFAMAHMSLRKLREGDDDSAARFRLAARRLVDLHDEIRDQAKECLHTNDRESRELMEVLA